ncbi:helix-turn-helix transcriptional regulator [Butyricicoccus sp.]|uniref:helix-turn-helix transcriptional regulator n=1 Tax=Butyricicoccus sp. TaxID=2049021 RepID=UPI003F191ACC
MENTSIDFVYQFLKINHIPVRFIQPPCDNLTWLDMGLRENILHSDASSADELNHWLATLHENKIYHTTDDFQCNYTMIRLPDSDELLVCGPVLFEEMRAARLTQICDKLNVPEELRDQIRDYYYRVVFIPAQTLYLSIFTILGNQLFGENNYEAIYSDFGSMEEMFRNYEYYYRVPDKPFLSIQMIEERYELENATLNAVANGNESKALETCAHWTTHQLPQRLANELRDSKDYTITLNTLLRKTVEQAGVHPIHIDSVSNRNIQMIEQLSSIEQCQSFRSKMIRTYCLLVRKHNLKNYSLLTQKIITYVDTELCADLSLKALSERLSVNASYLSTLFKKEMGMSLTDFVNHRRISHAQKLLISTEMPIKSVALKCGIPDVYYFSRLFKRITGTTPKAYRNNTNSFEQYQEMTSPSAGSPESSDMN